MTGFHTTPWLAALLMLASACLTTATAQPAAADEALRQVASRSVGMPIGTVEISTGETVLTVVRLTSKANASTHEGRNNEATAIAAAVADEFTRRGTQYAGIQSISVDYVERTGMPAHNSLVDRFAFRKNGAGKFELHIT